MYDFTPTKHGTGPADYLEGFKGILLADGGSEFNEAVRQRDLTRAGCWSHARRYFFDAGDTSPARSREALDRIGVLFDIERGIKDADLETRRRVRATDTREALGRIHAWLAEHVHKQRPSTPIGKAFAYALNQWASLEVCASRPEIPIHNNMSELQLRRPVIGRKNWLFAGSEGGAQAAATLLSLVGSCRLHGIDPWEYLRTVLGVDQRPAREQGRRAGAVPCGAGASGRGVVPPGQSSGDGRGVTSGELGADGDGGAEYLPGTGNAPVTPASQRRPTG